MEVGEVHLGAPLVLHRDQGHALAGPGRDLAHPGERGRDLLDRLRHQTLEVLGRDVLVDGENGEAGIGDRGQQIDG
jgi:hypothetical protein